MHMEAYPKYKMIHPICSNQIKHVDEHILQEVHTCEVVF